MKLFLLKLENKDIFKYMGRVADGKERTSTWFKLQCQRHFNDLEQAKDKGWVFNEREAQKHVNFLTKVARHGKDRWAGKLFDAQPFQCVMQSMLFGWQMHSDDTGGLVRRFATLYFDIARKNGKTETVAAIANDVFTNDARFGVDIYCAATKREQALITFKAASNQMRFMMRHSSSLRRKVKRMKFNMEIPSEDGNMQPVSSDHNSLDGLNPLMAIIDEYHAHKTSNVLDVMETGMGSRWDGPILAITTTAGFDKTFPCFEFRKNAMEVLKGERKDDRLLPFIFAMDDDDDWQDENNWYKSNPNLGVSVSLEFLRGQWQKAVNEGPSKQRQFQTKNLNMWVDADQVWIEKDVWVANSKLTGTEHYEKLYGKKCYGGLDISSVRDLTSIALAFPVQPGLKQPHLIVYHFCPERRVREMQRKGLKHAQWVSEGWLSATADNVVDHQAVQNTILDIHKKFKLKNVYFDRYGAVNVVTPLMRSGIKFIEHGQGFVSMSEPTKAFERAAYSKDIQIEHFGNPLLTWEIGSVAIKTDPADNIKPDKQNANGQIDGVVAAIMAWGAMEKGESVKSAYAGRGLRTIG